MSNYQRSTVEEMAEVFKALSNPNRLRILSALAFEDGACPTSCDDLGACKCVGELGRDLDIVPSTVSHHIKELHRVGLIRLKRHGQTVECSVDYETLDSLSEFLGQRGSPVRTETQQVI